MAEPKILYCDIETTPLLVYAWALGDQTISLNQLVEDWSILSWAAKWRGSSEVMYEDVRGQRNLRDDKRICKKIWQLLDEADIVIWHYGKNFDHGKLNARFIQNDMKPPSFYDQIDTKHISSKNFKFTSNKLEYLTDKLNKKHKKSKHKKFPGMDLWIECMKGNLEAFNEMEKYNKLDILSLEETYERIQPWQKSGRINFNIFNGDSITNKCNCGSSNLMRYGFRHKSGGKFQRWKCNDCGAEAVDSGSANNAMSKEKKAGLKRISL